jgi:hypothetical protein
LGAVLWGRWFDLGTSDAIALDVLITSLRQFSKDYVVLESLIIGGENEDWTTGDSRYRSDTFSDTNELN